MSDIDEKNINDDDILDHIAYDDNDTEECPDINRKEVIDETISGSIVDNVGKAKTIIRANPIWLKVSIVILSILVVAISIASFYTIKEKNRRVDNLLKADHYYEGIYVDDISLGGQTKEEALKLLDKASKLRAQEVYISLVWENDKIKFDNEDLEVSFNTKSILDEAWNVGREGDTNIRYEYIMSLIDNPIHYETQMDINPQNIESKVKAIALFREKIPGEAAVSFNPDSELEGSEWFVYSEPVEGVKTDPETLWTLVESAIENQTFGEIEIPKQKIEPTITIEDLIEKTQLLVQFKTHMARSSNREHNVRLACLQINGTILMPGEEFSMNETTGKRTQAAGYKEANIIIGGNQLIPGIAGGVCQVSGTLFNAAVRADLEITERYHHSFELSYLTRGRDATVNYGTADLRFKNTSNSPIYISMYTIKRDVYAEIYGVPLADGMRIGMDVKTTKTEQPGPKRNVADSEVSVAESPLILQGRTGIRCTTYKVFYDKDGKIIEKIPLFSDYYKPYPEEYHYNPAVMPPN
ncbi:MAG: VanW family protein [Clostridiales bacterium]|nr:VanW family protein [Clostridiales bacterium]